MGLPTFYLIDLVSSSVPSFHRSRIQPVFQSINAPKAIDSEGARRHRRRALPGWQPRRIDFWATFPSSSARWRFNVTTFAAFASVGWLGYEVIVWSRLCRIDPVSLSRRRGGDRVLPQAVLVGNGGPYLVDSDHQFRRLRRACFPSWPTTYQSRSLATWRHGRRFSR